MTTLVSFQLAKLLKEKGFDAPSIHYWFERGTGNIPTRTIDYRSEDWNKYPSGLRISAPTITEVVMWLYEKHEVWIDVRYMDNVANFGFCVTTLKDNTEQTELYYFNTPTEAYEAAIEYVLNNLI